MSKEKINQNEEAVVAAVSKTETFIREKKGLLYGVLIAIVAVIVIYVGYTKLIHEPRQAEALQQMYPAEASFRAGDYDKALNGDDQTMGFSQIISKYGNKAGKAVYLYAGICELQAGNYESAISYLNKYSTKETILAARALACIGDAYVGLGDYGKAVSYFEKAAAKSDNMYSATYLLKAGVTYEELGNNEKALECYNTIKNKYPQSMEGYDIDKYISRIEVK